jgi:hypothetical protein
MTDMLGLSHGKLSNPNILRTGAILDGRSKQVRSTRIIDQAGEDGGKGDPPAWRR